MAISAAEVKHLRDKTGAGMMDCKKALEQTGGDIEAAIDVLRKSGVAKAEKRAGRAAAEGLIASAITASGDCGVLVEVNCETDFVARNDDFRAFVKDVAALAVEKRPRDVEALRALPLGGQGTVNEVLVALIAKIGENMLVRRCVVYSVNGNGTVAAYVHHGDKVGVLVEVSCTKPETVAADGFREAVRDVALQVAAHSPGYIRSSEIPAAVLDRERDIYRAQVENKPAHVVDKIVEGKLSKFYAEVCLLDQEFVKDREMSVAQYLGKRGKEVGDTIEIKQFSRFAVGESEE
ncbi:MAG: elongation factor Ts [Verrucomicrobia bacterium]|nr:elongation factor Ts [Verrucomicrobiota bacterium]